MSEPLRYHQIALLALIPKGQRVRAGHLAAATSWPVEFIEARLRELVQRGELEFDEADADYRVPAT